MRVITIHNSGPVPASLLCAEASLAIPSVVPSCPSPCPSPCPFPIHNAPPIAASYCCTRSPRGGPRVPHSSSCSLFPWRPCIFRVRNASHSFPAFPACPACRQLACLGQKSCMAAPITPKNGRGERRELHHARLHPPSPPRLQLAPNSRLRRSSRCAVGPC
jgi:hypothetical protein